MDREPSGEGRHTQHASEKRVAAHEVTGHLTAVWSGLMEFKHGLETSKATCAGGEQKESHGEVKQF